MTQVELLAIGIGIVALLLFGGFAIIMAIGYVEYLLARRKDDRDR